MKIYQLGILFTYVFIIFSCKNEVKKKTSRDQAEKNMVTQKIEVQGHRGDRGNFPENSIPAFLSAIKKGVDVIEMDVVISKDNKVVVSHEPFMSSLYMLHSNGQRISKEEETELNLFKMNYDSIKQFDSGSGGNKKFPQQKVLKTYKPLLTEVIDTVEAFIHTENIPPIKYNIEIKSEAEEYGKSQPLPEDFVELVANILQQKNITERVILQSFDPEILEVIHQKHPDMYVSFLVEDASLEENLKKLSFTPQVYSPYYKMIVDSAYVKLIKNHGMKLIPWTVNREEDIKKLITLGVDGIITDYPERVIKNLDKSQRVKK